MIESRRKNTGHGSFHEIHGAEHGSGTNGEPWFAKTAIVQTSSSPLSLGCSRCPWTREESRFTFTRVREKKGQSSGKMSALIISSIDYFQPSNLRGVRSAAPVQSLHYYRIRYRGKTKLADANFRGNWLRPNSPLPSARPTHPLSPSLYPSRVLSPPLSLCSVLFKRNLWGASLETLSRNAD